MTSNRQAVLAADSPPVHNINPEGIPEDLTSLTQWVNWAWVRDGDKWTKVPKQASCSTRNASSTDPATWSDFPTALAAAEANGLGIGFVLNGLVGIDLDDCREPETGKLLDWAQDIVDHLKTYTEVSPSGTGIKLFLRGQLPDGFRKKHQRPDGDGAVEIFSTGRFFTVTGQREYGTPDSVKDRQHALNAIVRLVESWKPEPPVRQRSEPVAIRSTDDNRMDRGRAYLAQIPGAVSNQRGHDHTFNTALKLVSLGKAIGLSRSEIDDLMFEWNQTCKPPWSDEELAHKIDGAIESNPAPMPDRERDANLPVVDMSEFLESGKPIKPNEVKPEQPTTKSKMKATIRTARELVSEFPAMRPPVIDGLIRRGETMNIVAAPKMGKSWLSMAMALDVANGGKMFGRFWATRGKVLIIDNELHSETSSNRLPKIAQAMGIDLDHHGDNVSVINLRGGLVDMAEMTLWLNENCSPGQFALIILDAWYRFLPAGKDENSNADVAALYNLLDETAAKLDCAFACVHHSSKGNQSGKSVTDTGSGAGSQSRAADCHLVMRQHEEQGVVVVEAAVRSFPPVDPFCLRWVFPTFQPADDLDPAALKQERPAGRKRTGADTTERHENAEQIKLLRALEAYAEYPNGETENTLAITAKMNPKTFASVQDTIIASGFAESCQVQKSRTKYSGFKITESGQNELRQLRLLRQNNDESELSDNASNRTPTSPVPLGTDCQSEFVRTANLSDQQADEISGLFGVQSA